MGTDQVTKIFGMNILFHLNPFIIYFFNKILNCVLFSEICYLNLQLGIDLLIILYFLNYLYLKVSYRYRLVLIIS